MGDVCGEGVMLASLPPYRSAFYERRLGWVEWFKRTFLAWLACLIFALLIAAFVAGLFLFATQPSLAKDYEPPEACRALASKYAIPPRLSQDEAEQAVAKLNQYSWWPGVRQCRRAVKREWKM